MCLPAHPGGPARRRPGRHHRGRLAAAGRRGARARAAASGDVLVVTQKVVSKAEGRIVRPGARSSRARRPSPSASAGTATRARWRWCCASRSRSCAWSGASSSRAPATATCAPTPAWTPPTSARADEVTLLPVDSGRLGAGHPGSASPRTWASRSAVIVSDSFGRPWRWGIVDVALGVAGFSPLDDHARPPGRRGPHDARHGRRGRGRDRVGRRAGLGQDERPAAGPGPRRDACRPATARWSATWSCPSPRTCSRSARLYGRHADRLRP